MLFSDIASKSDLKLGHVLLGQVVPLKLTYKSLDTCGGAGGEWILDTKMRPLIPLLILIRILPQCWQQGFAIASSVPLTLNILPNGTITTTTNLTGSIPDPQFHLEPTYKGKTVDYISVFVNAVSVLRILAHQEFGEQLTKLPELALADYQDVDIEVKPISPYRNFENKLAIWGIYGAVQKMVLAGQFVESRYELFWGGKKVAVMFITSIQLPQTSNNETLLAGTTNSSITDLTSADGLGPEFHYPPHGASISLPEVFMTTLATLQTLAYWKDTDAVYSFTLQAEHFDSILQVRTVPRTQPPYFLCGYAIDTVSLIPFYMMDKTRWADIDALLTFDKIYVGDVSLYRPQKPPMPSVLVA